MYGNRTTELKEIIHEYENIIRGIYEEVSNSEKGAYGGVIRAENGKLVEKITKSLVVIAWKDLGKNIDDISLEMSFQKSLK